MKKILPAVLGLLVPALAAVAQSNGPAITLQQCIDAALARGPDNRIRQAGLAISRAQFAAIEAQNAFSLRANLGYSDSWTLGNSELAPGGTGSLQGAQAGVSLAGPTTSLSVTAYPYVSPASSTASQTSAVSASLSQTLWNGYPGGQGKAAVEKARIALQVQELTAQTDLLNLTYTIKQAYFSMLSAQGNVALEKEILQKQKSLLQQVEALNRLEQASDVDVKTAEVNVSMAQADLDGYLHDLRMAGIRLADLMGRPPEEPFSVAEVDVPQAPAQTMEQAVAGGLSRRTDIKQLELNRRSVAVDLALVRGKRTPSVSVNAGISGAVDWSADSGWAATAGVQLGIPVLDSGAARRLEETDRLQDRLYTMQEQKLRGSIAADIEDAYGSLKVQLERVEAAKAKAETLALQFQLVQVQNNFGTATNQDLLNAAVDEADARTALARSKSDAQLAALKLQNVMGY